MFCPFCGEKLYHILSFCGSCGGDISFLKNYQDGGSEAETLAELIHKYYMDGHSMEMIVELLVHKHNFTISVSTLKRRLLDANLCRRTKYTPIEIVRMALCEELKGSGKLLGYRAMWQTLKQKYSFVVRRYDVMCLMRELNPTGIRDRSRHRFIRRAYYSKGPNEVWHIDGYDKLKPFGIAVSGCIDGFSRQIMWLKCGKSNNDPKVIAQNYISCVSEYGIFPSRLRTDCGTENGLMAALHCFLRSPHTDEFAGVKSHMYGTSTSNQRIESWWSYFRKQRSQFWIDLFGDMRERHLFNGSYEQTCLLRYCFLDVLQEELDQFKHYWNTHTIRPVRQSKCPSGKPEAMYHVPHRFNGRNCGFAANTQVLNHLESLIPAVDGGNDHLQLQFEELQRQRNLPSPVHWESAVENYVILKNMAGL